MGLKWQLALSSTYKILFMSTTHFVTLDAAKALTTNFQSKKEQILDAAFQGQEVLPTCETFERSAFDALLAQTGVEKIRIYLGMDSSNKVKMVIAGVNSGDNDMLPQTSSTVVSGEDILLEDGVRCPNMCPPSSDLNTF